MNNYSVLLNKSNIFLKLTTAKSHKLDKEKLNSFNTPKEAYDYLISLGFALIGTGSSRHAFVINSKKAIKLIKRPGGRNQNKMEYEILTSCASPIIPRIYDHADNFWWIEVELVRPTKIR